MLPFVSACLFLVKEFNYYVDQSILRTKLKASAFVAKLESYLGVSCAKILVVKELE